jgi:hypothetical protein
MIGGGGLTINCEGFASYDRELYEYADTSESDRQAIGLLTRVSQTLLASASMMRGSILFVGPIW